MQRRTLKVDLLFDGFERDGRLYCVLAWGGPSSQNVPTLRCVIESLSTKFQVFAASGAVLRATVSVGLKEADRVAPLRAARR
ncbi:MAG TPA: hypothetical protein VGM88_11985 [Kofleriaceae bacterium]|jgi:hypothetical protein